MSKRKQKTLGVFGFTKKVVHRGKEEQVAIPNFVKEEEVFKVIPCLQCPQKFKTQQGLSIHIKCKHAR